MPQLLRCSLIMSLLLLILVSSQTYAQTEPDSVQRKQELPTGPPMQPEPARRSQQPRSAEPPLPPPPPVPKSEVQVEPEEEFKEKVPLIDRLYYGGSLGLQFGTYTNISLMPILGYRVTDKFSIGGGVVYQFRRAFGLTLQNYGGRAFTQVELFDIGDGAILAHGEVEYLSSEYFPYANSNFKERRAIALPMAGIGYRQRISEKASFDFLLLYNFNDDDIANPYNNPIMRAGINIPFTR